MAKVHSDEEPGVGAVKPGTKCSRSILIGFIVLGACFAVSIGYIIYMNSPVNKFEDTRKVIKKEYPGTCTTNTCLLAAARLISARDESYDPCENFYEYACGNWEYAHPIGNRKYHHGTRIISEFVDAKLKALLEEKSKPDELESIVKMKDYYKSCMHLLSYKKMEDSRLKEYVGEMGVWPALHPDTWNQSDYDFIDMLTTGQRFGVTDLFRATVYGNADEKLFINGRLMIHETTRKGYSAFFSEHTSSLDEYHRFMVQVLTKFGNLNRKGWNQMLKVIDFEYKLFEIQVIGTGGYYTFTMDKLELSGPAKDFDWLRYFNSNLEAVNKTVSSLEGVMVQTEDFRYLQNLFELISNTSNRTMSNFLHWRMALKHMKNVYSDVYRFNEISTSKICIKKTNDNFKWTIGRLFSDNEFNAKSKQMVVEMVSNIKQSIYKIIDEKDWLNATSKVLIKQKIYNIEEKIGYPDYYTIDENLNEFYKDFVIDKGDFLSNVVSIAQAKNIRSLRNYNVTINRKEWAESALMMNAYYDPTDNKIYLFAGYMQGSMFNKENPLYLNYAGVGNVIGHEFTHSIDSNGIKLDLNGDSTPWLPESVLQIYRDKSVCFVDQYNKLTVVNRYMNTTVNGNITLSENIADVSGMKESFMAYKALKVNTDKPLPGLNLTIDQLFFLAAAQEYCIKQPPLLIRLDGVHTPSKQRLIGLMQNSENFSKAFNCKVGSKMSSEEKCSIW